MAHHRTYHDRFPPVVSPQVSAMRVIKRDTWINDDSELLTRTSWVDARVAYRQIRKGKAYGNTSALWLRSHLQRHLFSLGCVIQKHCGKVLFVGLLLLSLCCVGLKTATIETNVEKLWVEEGGRLERELSYTKKILGEGSGITSEIIIQTPKKDGNILSVDSLLLHYKAVYAATKVHVDMYDITWKIKDICYHSDFPSMEERLFDSILEKLMPCMIITPLDCFWEGSKLLGPEHGLFVPGHYDLVTWSNLNPKKLVKSLKDMGTIFPAQYVEELLERAGITTAYQERPCLNPNDPDCPDTAPNKHKQVPDVGAELTGGCQGFATKYMQWEEDLIVGGVHKNKSNYIVRAEALQSIIQLLGEKELYEVNRDQYRLHNVDWTQEKAKKVLEAWQRKFTQEVNRILNDSVHDEVVAFSSTSLMDILKEFSQVSVVRVALGYVLMLVYACVSLLRWTDAIQSQSGIGIAGVLLVALSVAAGLGVCSVIRIPFNASTTQIIPFLALGLGVDDMFLLAHTFAENGKIQAIPYMDQTGECMKRTGVSILLTSLSNMCAFFMAGIIPIPALRAFSLQAAILVLFNLGTILLVFPAIVSLDLIRRDEKRVDVFCCIPGSSSSRIIELQPGALPTPPEYREPSPPPPYSHGFNNAVVPTYNNAVVHQAITQTEPDGTRPVTVLASPEADRRNTYSSHESLPQSAASSRQCLTTDEATVSCRDHCVHTQRECCSWSLTWFAKRIYGPWLQKTSSKIFIIIGFAILLVIGIFGTVRVQDGLDLTDIVPRETNEFKFLDVQSKYFGFYHMYLVTQEDFNYAHNQELLYRYHQSFQPIKKIIKKEGQTLPKFWLHYFSEWLLNIQNRFDAERASGCIVEEKHCRNASDDGILGYKLMIQTGDIDNPVDKKRILTGRLVERSAGDYLIINPKAFYNLLSAWVSNDAIAYVASQADLQPLPREWYHSIYDHELKIPRSQPLVYAQLPFYLNNMSSTKDITNTVEQIRQICDTFKEEGLPNYPSGIPFTYWEQYINLRFYLMLALMCVLGGIFVVLTVTLMNPWAAVVVVAVLAMMVVELFGFMGLAGIKLSAVPAVILIVSVGIGVEFTVHICLGFLTGIGSRDRRMVMTLEHMFAPVIHGAISTLLGVIMLVGAEFDFIIRYFFVVLTALVILGMLNGLVLLPVLLALIGPRAEVIPLDHGDRLPPPTPEPSPQPERAVRSVSRRVYPRMPSDISLTTITEEPTQYSSHEIVVHPEVIVETSYPGGATCTHTNNSSRNPSEPSSCSSTPSCSTRHVTTVKAKATVTVEVHTPIPGCVDQEHNYKSKKRKTREDPSDSDSSSKC